MLRSEEKGALLLLGYSFFLREILTWSTLAFVILGVILIFFRIRTTKLFRNGMALTIFASYWLIYGKVIDPEIGLNFLVSVIVIKMLEKESERDRYMIFFGLLLLMASGSLFEKSLTYVLFFGASFFILIQDFYQELKLGKRMQTLTFSFSWVIPLTIGLFFFIPRLMNPIPFQYGPPRAGEVGYTPNVNISSVQSLALSDRQAFQVILDKTIRQDELYWRGNVLGFSDGWNWTFMPQDKGVDSLDPTHFVGTGIHQEIRLFHKEDFFFALDHPGEYVYQNKSVSPGTNATLSQARNSWVSRYEVKSFMQDLPSAEELKPFLRSSLTQDDKAWINETFKGEAVAQLSEEIARYYNEQGFTYSLSPGSVESFREFMETKKIGFCSHFASAAALILRVKKIPTRLVSGFMGGSYNPYGGFYLVSQNDAHVWVEVWEDGKWKRIDPTAWIVPDRVIMGGEAFMSSIGTVSKGGFSILRNSSFPFVKKAQQWFAQWDFRFYNWLEIMDYYTQDAWISRFKLNRKWFFSLAPLFLIVFVLLYVWQYRRKTAKEDLLPEEILWNQFLARLRAKGLELSLRSVEEGHLFFQNLEHPQKEVLRETYCELVRVSYEGASSEGLGKKISNL